MRTKTIFKIDLNKVVITGGSIAGCVSAILLQRLGLDVTVLERSTRPLIGRGAGVTLPVFLVEKCIAQELLDPDVPFITTRDRSFVVKEKNSSREIWTQPMALATFNWADLYANLRKRVPNKCFHIGEEVISAHKDKVLTASGKTFGAHWVIAADGVNSTLRKQIFPNLTPIYTKYIAWRGVCGTPEIVNNPMFDKRGVYFVFPGGNLLCYRIPANDFKATGRMLLNWLLYENHPRGTLKTLLTDKAGVLHTASLPPGSLSSQHLNHLHELAKKVLPSAIPQIVLQTETPFLQSIFDLSIPQFCHDNISFIGDAATVLRPHSASGVLKAFTDSFSFAEHFKNQTLSAWSDTQLKSAKQQLKLSQIMGEALVSHTPNWSNMSPEKMDQWWEALMKKAETTWYATNETRQTQRESKS